MIKKSYGLEIYFICWIDCQSTFCLGGLEILAQSAFYCDRLCEYYLSVPIGKWISLAPFVSLSGGNPDDHSTPPHPIPTHPHHTTIHTDTVSFCHNSVVIWWACVCMGRASSLASLLFAVGVLWLHVRPCLTPYVLSSVHPLSQDIRMHTHVHIILLQVWLTNTKSH